MKMGKCLQCNSDLPDVSGIAYCSYHCREEAKSERERYRNKILSSGTSGALKELAVCIDLMKMGWNVFRAVSPSCPCDLMIAKDSFSLRVEVKTGYVNLDGSIRHSGFRTDENKMFPDIIAIVMGDGTVIYQPSLPP
jgi:predicted nucleic acid-binding Zn ribbon protein